MLQYGLFKKIVVIGICLLGILYAMPNLFSEQAREEFPNFLPRNTVNLGLDLQGGASLLVEVRVADVFRERLQSILSDMRPALREAGVRRFTGVKLSSDNKISIRITNPEDLDTAKQVLNDLSEPVANHIMGTYEPRISVSELGNQTFQLELTDAARAQITNATMLQSLEVVRRRIDETGTREPSIQRQGEDRILVQVPGLDNAQQIIDLLGTTAVLNFHMVNTTVSRQDITTGRVPSDSMVLESIEEGAPAMAVYRRPAVRGEDLTDAQPSFDQNTGEAIVNFRFNTTGAKKFGAITRENVGRPFAIVLDNEIISAPVIREPILAGAGQISGNFDVGSAQTLSILLRAGALPAEITVLEQRTVGPDLGADSVAAGKIAGVVALAAVVIFIIASYGLFGVFASIALLVNVALIFGTLSLLGATLTLPGIAGIVLTIGIAVDANVLIFERVREELARKANVAQAISMGYSRAMSAIVDGNLTTFIVGGILFFFGSGLIKGFAVTLMIGIITSIFCALLVTQLLISVWYKRRRPKTITL